MNRYEGDTKDFKVMNLSLSNKTWDKYEKAPIKHVLKKTGINRWAPIKTHMETNIV